MSRSAIARSMALVLCLVCVLASGCHTFHHRKQKEPTPEVLYQQAHKRLVGYDYKAAIKLYESLTARFPFSDQARQARIDLIYAYYRQGEAESATDAADTFIRENPTHPRVDYAWYIKGLVYFDRPPNLLERLFHADLSKRPPTDARKSFDAFKVVVEQYPKSIYAHDALHRMIFLRNRLADYDVHVAEYYMRRGAWVGAANRANECIEEYNGAPAVRQALQIMTAAYQKLGLNQRADQAHDVYAYNFLNQPNQEVAGDPGHPWWKFWSHTPSDPLAADPPPAPKPWWKFW
ncbi:MAG TPA: outer membrane protein assembly factor BamD [Steroidobacteraceae bacterium]|nr:outer membrane protein assembly factor BamD [Steroidobacteraceae bacterium]